ncbi:MAG: UDP-N-acetylmuramate dehydrogenase [Candidatus Nealsonbacteria bacterium]
MKTKTKQLKNILPEIQFNIPLKGHTSFRIGGPAKYFFEAKTKKDLILALKTSKKLKLSFYILGGGSKLLVSDKGFRGFIIKVQNSKFKVQNCTIFAEAGLSLEKLTKIAAKKSLTGLEWSAGIPGTVGGAVRGNAGAWEKSMGDIIKEVEVFDVEKQKIINLNNKKCKFSYRNSIFKKNPNLVILSCQIKLRKGNRKKSEEEMKSYLDYRREHHPLEFPTAGSIFENIPYDKKSKRKKPEAIPSGRIIEDCGLAGKKIGNVRISKKHSNFIINLGNGKAKDVKKLIKLVKLKVKKKFGISLKEELQYL